MRSGWIGILLVAGIFASAGANAQSDCTMVPDSTKARCEEAMRIKKACAGLEGDTLKACQQKNMQYGHMKEDCSKLAGDAQRQCEMHNRGMGMASPCSGKTGAELEACVKAAGAAGAVTK